MATISLAHTAHETIPEHRLRGAGLFETYHDEMLDNYDNYQGAGKWPIPSGSTPDKLYEVRPGTRRKSARCECVGFQHHHHCSHVEAARLAACKSTVCDSCGKRHWRSALREVHEEDGLLSWFAGDRLCEKCIDRGAWA